jgi:phosphoglycolate phosphatase-like HAD superfamily hydrolase
MPTGVTACLFDLDGVLTQTAKVHSAAWKQMFDDYLRKRAQRTDEAFVPFDPIREYDQYVDGKPRYDGVRAFLASRGVELPEGDPSDTLDTETIDGLGNRKNEIVLRLIREQGVQPYEGSVRYVKAAQAAGLRRPVEPKQFASWVFSQKVTEAGLAPSVGAVGAPFDNAMVEAFWARMQVELLNRRRWKTRIELAAAIHDYIEIWHNTRRRHSALNMLTPSEYENQHQQQEIAA